MSKKQFIHTKNAPAAIGPYSQAIKSGNWIFTSGQIPIDPKTGRIVGKSDIQVQTKQVIKNLEAVLVRGGATLDDVIKTTVFLANINHYGAVNEIYEKYFKKSLPARSAVAVLALPKGVGIEIELVARIQDDNTALIDLNAPEEEEQPKAKKKKKKKKGKKKKKTAPIKEEVTAIVAEEIAPIEDVVIVDEPIVEELPIEEDVVVEEKPSRIYRPIRKAILPTSQRPSRENEPSTEDDTHSAITTVDEVVAPTKSTPLSRKPAGKSLHIIDGIGPKIAQLLIDGGITDLSTLADTPVERIKEILLTGGSRYQLADPSTWPEQASYAARGDMDGLKALKADLKRGRRK